MMNESYLTYYCTSNIIDSTSVAREISLVLDGYIRNKNFYKAREYVKSLNLKKENEKQLIKCVDSYLISC